MVRQHLFLAISVLILGIEPMGAAAPTEVSQAFAALPGLEANFVQRFRPRGFQKDQLESGSVIFGAAPRMRWSYQRPETKMFVFDGTTSWLYLPQDKQVTIDRLTEAEKRELPFLLLGDARAINEHYVVKESRGRAGVTVQMTSRSANQIVRTITLLTSPSNHFLKRLEYSDRQGNRTVFEFSNHRRIANTPSLFTFSPPPGVQVIQQD